MEIPKKGDLIRIWDPHYADQPRITTILGTFQIFTSLELTRNVVYIPPHSHFLVLDVRHLMSIDMPDGQDERIHLLGVPLGTERVVTIWHAQTLEWEILSRC